MASPGVERVVVGPELRAVGAQAISRRRVAHVAVARGKVDGNVLIELPGNAHQLRMLLVVIGVLHKVARDHDERRFQSVGRSDGLFVQCCLREGAVAWRLPTDFEQSELRVA